MNIRIETCYECEYENIQKYYGSVLNKFGLMKAYDGTAHIDINCLEDLFNLDKELRSFFDKKDDWYVYFGIVIKQEDEELWLEIKDNYD